MSTVNIRQKTVGIKNFLKLIMLSFVDIFDCHICATICQLCNCCI